MNDCIDYSWAVRFWNKLDRSGGPESCWTWLSTRNEKGYGVTSAGRKAVGMRAHRISWMLSNGFIPDGLCVLHSCDNPPCCNPSHLFLGTKADNTHDMMAKGRMKAPPVHSGDAHPMRRYEWLAEKMRGQNNGNSRTKRALRERTQ